MGCSLSGDTFMTVPRTLDQIEEFAMHRGPNTLDRLRKAKTYLGRSIGNPETDRKRARSMHLRLKRHIARLEAKTVEPEEEEEVA